MHREAWGLYSGVYHCQWGVNYAHPIDPMTPFRPFPNRDVDMRKCVSRRIQQPTTGSLTLRSVKRNRVVHRRKVDGINGQQSSVDEFLRDVIVRRIGNQPNVSRRSSRRLNVRKPHQRGQQRGRHTTDGKRFVVRRCVGDGGADKRPQNEHDSRH